jgi:transglutaminase-like putative cysteine protease
MRRYRLVHVTRYSYDEPVSISYGRAHLKPVDQTGQSCLSSELIIDPQAAETSDHRDYFGNLSTFFCVREQHSELLVSARSELAIERSPSPLDELSALTWEDVRDSLVEHAAIAEYGLPSARIRPSSEVDDYARSVFTDRRPVGDAVSELFHRIHADFTYQTGATTVRTTLPQLLAKRVGVCQDFAHLAVGCLRSVGLASRYVSGYLETQPAPGKPKLQGVDASHAWASVYLPGVGWLDFDPTNDQFVDDRYIVTAVGRDYADVPPLKGVIVTDSRKSTMQVSVDVTRLD